MPDQEDTENNLNNLHIMANKNLEVVEEKVEILAASIENKTQD